MSGNAKVIQMDPTKDIANDIEKKLEQLKEGKLLLRSDDLSGIVAVSCAEAINQSRTTFHEYPLDEFAKLLAEPADRSPETVAEFKTYNDKDNQPPAGTIGKDANGYFLLCEFTDGHRKKDCFKYRTGFCLDIDSGTPEQFASIRQQLPEEGINYFLYTTRKHTPEKPRYRVVVPFLHPVPEHIFEGIARRYAKKWDILESCDQASFRVVQAMYFPTLSSDSEYIVESETNKHNLDAEAKAEEFFDNPADVSQWDRPENGKVKNIVYNAPGTKKKDPKKAPGWAGAFNRTHPMTETINKFLPDVYRQESNGRFTYIKGETTNGAVVHDDLLLVSYHSSDPANTEANGDENGEYKAHAHNSFDIVRIHKFGHLDKEPVTDQDGVVIENPKPHQMPSYKAMVKFIKENDPETVKRFNEEKIKAEEEKQKEIAKRTKEKEAAGETPDWAQLLEMTANGEIRSTISNMRAVIEYHPQLYGRIKYNLFSGSIIVNGKMPWKRDRSATGWTDADSSQLAMFIEDRIHIHSKEKMHNALTIAAMDNQFNPVHDYIKATEWDGVLRIESALIDFFDCDDSSYTRSVSRILFVGAVARVFQPGIKLDTMTVIKGPQGVGKSEFCKRIGGEWYIDIQADFNDSKAVAEILQTGWIVEVGELSAFRKADAKALKQLVSARSDRYRAAYARVPEDHPRHCILIGTTNEESYLRDKTGNRRFLPIDTGPHPRLSFWDDLTPEYVSQLWAEAYSVYREAVITDHNAGTKENLEKLLILTKDEQETLNAAHERHIDEDSLQAPIEAFLEMKIPNNWYENIETWMRRYRDQYKTYFVDRTNRVADSWPWQKRQFVTPHELWVCCGDGSPEKIGNIPWKERERIKAIMNNLPGWKWKRKEVGGKLGKPNGWERVPESNDSHGES